MTKGFRKIDQPIDHNTLADLEGLTRDDILQTLHIALPSHAARRVINRLHNKQHQRKAKTIKAFQLTSQGFEPMAEIDIDVDERSVHGRITSAVDIGNASYIAIAILNDDHREATYLVGREDPVRVWKKDDVRGVIRPRPAPDYDKPVEHGFLRVGYIAEHLNTFFGKRISIRYKGVGTLRGVEVFADEPDAFRLTLDDTVYWTHKDDVVQVHRVLPGPGGMRPGPYPWRGSVPAMGDINFMTTAYSHGNGRSQMPSGEVVRLWKES